VLLLLLLLIMTLASIYVHDIMQLVVAGLSVCVCSVFMYLLDEGFYFVCVRGPLDDVSYGHIHGKKIL
jgi:hypothetical protein